MTDKYWVGGTGNWSDDTNHWALSDGGTPGVGNLPTASDNVFFTALSSPVDYTLTVDDLSLCLDLNMGAPASGKITLVNTTGTSRVSGNLNLSGGSSGIASPFPMFLQMQGGTGNLTVFTGGVVFTQAGGYSFNSATSTWKFLDSFTATAGNITLTAGTLDLNGNTISIPGLFSNNSNVRGLTSTSPGGRLQLTGTGNVIIANTVTNFTVTRNSWDLRLTGNFAGIIQITCGTLTWPSLTWTNTNPAGSLRFTVGSLTFKSISYTGGVTQTLFLTAGTTTTVEDDNGFPTGTVGAIMTIASVTAANHNLSKSGGGLIGSTDYMSISRSQAAPGSTWYAGTHSTNGGNNSGWIFTAVPSGVVVAPPAGGDSTGYRRKRRVLRRLIRRRPEVRAQVESFLAESASTLTQAGVLPGSAAEELAQFHAVLAEILDDKAQNLRAATITQIVRESVVDSLLQAFTAEEEEAEEEAVVLAFLKHEFDSHVLH